MRDSQNLLTPSVNYLSDRQSANLSINTKALDVIKSGGPGRCRTCNLPVMSRPLYR